MFDRGWAKTYNRTVIFTIHQPRSNIVALFDRLVLLADGRTVYSGPFSSCQQYFDRVGYSCPPGFNIADYLAVVCLGQRHETFHHIERIVGIQSTGGFIQEQNTRAINLDRTLLLSLTDSSFLLMGALSILVLSRPVNRGGPVRPPTDDPTSSVYDE
jgi:ABC-type multidrug transport system ATPase subunit